MNKERLVEYINFRIEQEKQLKPYEDLLGEDLPIYRMIYDANAIAEKLMGINEDMNWYINEYAITKARYGYVPSPDGYEYWNKDVRSVEDLAEYLEFLKVMEGRL